MARALRGKMVSLDHPGKPFAERGAAHVNLLSNFEYVCPDGSPRLELGSLL